MSIGMSELILILIVALLLLGGKRIPELARAFGRAASEYKKAKEMFKKEANDIKDSLDDSEKPQEYQLKDDVKNPEV